MAKYSIQLRNLIELVGEETVKSWFSDYELSDYLTAEEIAVINERGTWTSWRHWKKSDKPLPSGLLGPVTLVTQK